MLTERAFYFFYQFTSKRSCVNGAVNVRGITRANGCGKLSRAIKSSRIKT